MNAANNITMGVTSGETVAVHLPHVMRKLSLRVGITGQREFAIRTRVGIWLLQLAGLVMGCDLDVTDGLRAKAGEAEAAPEAADPAT